MPLSTPFLTRLSNDKAIQFSVLLIKFLLACSVAFVWEDLTWKVAFACISITVLYCLLWLGTKQLDILLKTLKQECHQIKENLDNVKEAEQQGQVEVTKEALEKYLDRLNSIHKFILRLFSLTPLVLLLLASLIFSLQQYALLVFVWICVMVSFHLICQPSHQIFRSIVTISVVIFAILLFYRYGEDNFQQGVFAKLHSNAQDNLNRQETQLQQLVDNVILYDSNYTKWYREIYTKNKRPNEDEAVFNSRLMKEIEIQKEDLRITRVCLNMLPTK